MFSWVWKFCEKLEQPVNNGRLSLLTVQHIACGSSMSRITSRIWRSVVLTATARQKRQQYSQPPDGFRRLVEFS